MNTTLFAKPFASLVVLSLAAALAGCATTGTAPSDHLGFAGTPSPLFADNAARTNAPEARREVAVARHESSHVRIIDVTREVTCPQCRR